MLSFMVFEKFKISPFLILLKIGFLRYVSPPLPEYPITLFPDKAASNGGSPVPSKFEKDK